eukprot:Gregarina_sp_Pseudo_9__5959@NODE_96_length_4316_cov_27_208090_g88_i0_p3_GENE_NODE_96_length_4316_cov_27_208090_g88_i0NODE_96_length_4316_cov_27_208090_g88_i0_p3_ORF_typecomplete_len312_score29_22_NODE_96_length_4316_cov_27_208090_g88_i014742409
MQVLLRLLLLQLFSTRQSDALWTPDTLVAKPVYVSSLATTTYVGSTKELLCSSGKAISPPEGFEAVNDERCQTTCWNKCATNAVVTAAEGSASADPSDNQKACLRTSVPDCSFDEFEVELYPADFVCAKSAGLMQLRLSQELSAYLYSQITNAFAIHLQLNVNPRTQSSKCESGTMPFSVFLDSLPTDRCSTTGGIPSLSDSLGDLKFIHIARPDAQGSSRSLMILELPRDPTAAFIKSSPTAPVSLSFAPYGCCSQTPVTNQTLVKGVVKVFAMKITREATGEKPDSAAAWLLPNALSVLLVLLVPMIHV